MYGEQYTKEQDDWILENADLGIFRNQKHFTDVFNTIFGTSHSVGSMNAHLYRMGIVVKTEHHKKGCSEVQKKWLMDNFDKYNFDFVSMADDFNHTFGTNKSNCCLAKYCERTLKLYTPRKKKHVQKKDEVSSGNVNNIYRNNGMFVRGKPSISTNNQLPIGTIRFHTSNHVRFPVIKVQLCNGDSGSRRGHSYKRPWWIPLKEKVWTDAYGTIPNGFCVICVDGDQMNCDLNNLMLLDKRGTAIMASHKWWMDNKILTQNAVTWCNLYFVAKDTIIDV